MKRVFIISTEKFAYLVNEERQSGFWMSNIEYDDGEKSTVYSMDLIYTDKELSNSELWHLFEKHNIRAKIFISDSYRRKSIFFDGNKFEGAKFEIGDRWKMLYIM